MYKRGSNYYSAYLIGSIPYAATIFSCWAVRVHYFNILLVNIEEHNQLFRLSHLKGFYFEFIMF